MRYAVIMAGGSGRRLWPLSRRDTPKQLLKLVGEKSLIRIAFERLDGVIEPSNVLVCTGADYADLVAEELPEIDPANILGEPEGRDSLNAVAWPAALLAARDPEAVVAVLPADHVMEPVATFRSALAQGFALAEADPQALVTFGVVPTSPHTGFGYLERGKQLPGHPDASRVVAFKEKPSLELAREYVDSGGYWWNSGMFVWRAQTLLDQLQILLPVTHQAVIDLAREPSRLGDIYPRLQKISVDYAVMEPVASGAGTAHVVAVRLPITWQDVGGYAALGDHLPRDAGNNAVSGVTVLLDAKNNVVVNQSEEGRLVAALGVSDTIIVQTPQITLVCPLSESERIKELLTEVTDQLGSSYA